MSEIAPPGESLAFRSWRGRCVALGVALLTFNACSRSPAVATDASTPIVLRVATDGEFLAFAPTELTCPTGARVRLIFHHAGQRLPQEHNWVLVLPGAADAVMQAGIVAGEKAGFVPKNDTRVLAATPLCGRGAEAVIEFTAPPPGEYPFICTFPGHGAEMRGILRTTTP
jgi:azurin